MKTLLLSCLLLVFGCVGGGGESSVSDGFNPGATVIQPVLPKPEVLRVELPAESTYTAGEILRFKIKWSLPVDVTGSPSLRLDISGSTKFATYSEGSGTDELTFDYTVLPADNDIDGINLLSPLLLNSGSIKSSLLQLAQLTFSTGGPTGVNVDGGVPAIVSLEAPTSGIYETGSPIEITALFNRPVVVSSSPRIVLSIGSGNRNATYFSGSGTSSLVFKYTPTTTDVDLDGISSATTITLNGGAIKSPSGINALLGFASPDFSGVFVNATAPIISAINAPSAGSYRASQDLNFSVVFDRPVIVAGSPSLTLDIGGLTRQAVYVSGSGTNTLLLKYTLTAGEYDGNGIGVTSPVALNSGSIQSRYGPSANLGFQSPNTSLVLVDGIAPTISSVDLPTSGTYQTGTPLTFVLHFNRTMTVDTSNGTPRIQLAVGAVTRFASYVSGSGSGALTFRYTIASSDFDSDGMAISSALQLNGGTLSSSIGNGAVLTMPTLDTSNIFINSMIPAITSLIVPANKTYGIADRLNFSIVFDRVVNVTGTPSLTLDIGGVTRQATYVSGTGTTTLSMRYVVVAGDSDENGTDLVSPLNLNSGSIKSVYGREANLSFTAPATNGLVIDGIAPTVSSVSVPAEGIYKTGDQLNFGLTFNRPMVLVTTGGTPRLKLKVGSVTRFADYVPSSDSNKLNFSYTVAPADFDNQGIQIASPLDLNGATLNSEVGNSADLIFSTSGVANIFINTTVPVISSVTVPVAGTYASMANLNFTVVFDRIVEVTGTPTLQLSIGGVARAATYVSGSGSTVLLMRHTIAAGDSDPNGIDIMSPLLLNSGSIRSTYGVNASLIFTPPDSSSILIDAVSPGVATVTLPPNKTYKNSDVLTFSVDFDRPVTVATTGGTPRLRLTVGSETKYAAYTSGSGTQTLIFASTVGSTDFDDDGITLSSPLELNGGTISSSLGNPALRTFTSPSGSGVLVDGESPHVLTMTPPANKTYGIGETFSISLTFNRDMIVDSTLGNPTLGLMIGSTPKNATYESGSGSRSLVFRYTVAEGDVDADGVRTISPIALNGSTLKSSAGNTANLSFTPPSTPLFLIDGSRPRISSLNLPANKTFKQSEAISLSLNFDQPVTVLGTPRLGFVIGSSTVYANYVSGSGSAVLVFSYSVTSSDEDQDGITVLSPIDLNSGSIKSSVNNQAVLTFTPPLSSGLLVDGITPSVTSVSPPSNGSYGNGASILLSLNFNRAITVNTTNGVPRVPVTVGSVLKYATYHLGSGTSSLTFRFVVGPSDIDTDGIQYASSIDVNGGTLQSQAGNTASTGFISPATGAVLIAAGNPVIASISPPTNGNYDRSSNASMSFTVNFDVPVFVTGAPRLVLNVGGVSRYATLTSGSGSTALRFTYTIVSPDLDMDGVSFSSIDLNGGSINSSTGAQATLTFTSPNLENVFVVYPDMLIWLDPKDSSTTYQSPDCSTTLATLNNQTVGCIRDKSGKNNHFVQTDSTARPVFKTNGIQGHPALSFDGANDVMGAANSSLFDAMGALTAIVVILPTNVDGNPRGILSKRVSSGTMSFSMFLFSGKNMYYDFGGSRTNNSTTFASNVHYLTTVHFDGSQPQAARTNFFIDGTLNTISASTSATAPTTASKFWLGSLNEGYGQGHMGFIGEVIFFRRSLSKNANDELARIHAYLQAKWNI